MFSLDVRLRGFALLIKAWTQNIIANPHELAQTSYKQSKVGITTLWSILAGIGGAVGSFLIGGLPGATVGAEAGSFTITAVVYKKCQLWPLTWWWLFNQIIVNCSFHTWNKKRWSSILNFYQYNFYVKKRVDKFLYSSFHNKFMIFEWEISTDISIGVTICPVWPWYVPESWAVS